MPDIQDLAPENSAESSQSRPGWSTSLLSMLRWRRSDGSLPTASFFRSASNAQILGGEFINQMGPQANVQVHVHVRGSNPPGDPASHPPTDNIERRPPSSCSDEIPGERQSEPVHVAVSSIERDSHDIYQDLLEHERRGFPLWIPSPNLRLPVPYRLRGVCIGDVGIFTPEGGFDFLFNVCLPASDPRNAGMLPPDFEPLNPPLAPYDIREFKEFSAGSYIASPSIYRVHANGDDEFATTSFEATQSEGAILMMPHGAYVEELNNVPRLKRYFAENAEKFYRFVNDIDTIGRNVTNGKLRLVYGCRKSTAFGIATRSNTSLPRPLLTQLKFVTQPESGPESPVPCGYRWNISGPGLGKVGPEDGENEDLGVSNIRGVRNQCLFVNVLEIKLADKVWKTLEMKDTAGLEHCSTAPGRSQNSSSIRDPFSINQSVGNATVQSSISPGSSASQSRSSDSAQTLPTGLMGIPHVSDILQNYLLEKAPQAKMAIVCDDDWSLSLEKDQDPAELLQKELIKNGSMYVFYNSPGSVYFKRIELQPPNNEDLEALFTKFTNSELTYETYMFGGEEDRSTKLLELIDDIQEKCQNFGQDYTDKPATNYTSYPELAGHPARPFSLYDIRAYADTPRAPFFHETIADFREMLASCPHFNGRAELCMRRLADRLLNQYWRSGHKNDLNEAIWYYQYLLALPSTTYDLPELEIILALCSALYRRFFLLHQVNDLYQVLILLKKQLDPKICMKHLFKDIKLGWKSKIPKQFLHNTIPRLTGYGRKLAPGDQYNQHGMQEFVKGMQEEFVNLPSQVCYCQGSEPDHTIGSSSITRDKEHIFGLIEPAHMLGCQYFRPVPLFPALFPSPTFRDVTMEEIYGSSAYSNTNELFNWHRFEYPPDHIMDLEP